MCAGVTHFGTSLHITDRGAIFCCQMLLLLCSVGSGGSVTLGPMVFGLCPISFAWMGDSLKPWIQDPGERGGSVSPSACDACPLIQIEEYRGSPSPGAHGAPFIPGGPKGRHGTQGPRKTFLVTKSKERIGVCNQSASRAVRAKVCDCGLHTFCCCPILGVLVVFGGFRGVWV